MWSPYIEWCWCLAEGDRESTRRVRRSLLVLGMHLCWRPQPTHSYAHVSMSSGNRSEQTCTPVAGDGGQAAAPERRKTAQQWLWPRFYSVLIFWSLFRLAVMDSDTELVPLIHAPPSLKRSSGKGPQSKTSVTTVALSPSGSRM